jgi:Dcp1-like decapping family
MSGQPAKQRAAAGGVGAGVSVLTRDGATAGANLTVLRRTDPLVEEVLGTAGHVCLYSFDVDKKEWVRGAASALARSRRGRQPLWRARSLSLPPPAEPERRGGLHVRRAPVRLPAPARRPRLPS